MLPYINHSESALQLELKNLTRIKQLVKEMEKPKNFTYIDILNLHEHLDNLEKYLEQVIKDCK